GQQGKVTIATNMAGRGTDIVLGSGVTALGGLHILGTERHESRRIDNQLRGRSGRQGDPGSSRFFLSLEDDLMRLFGSERISGLMLKLGLTEGEAIENAMVSRAVENAQKRVEGHHFEIRKTLLEYDNVMSQQREVIYALRRELMLDADIESMVGEFLDDLLEEIYTPLENAPEDGLADAEALVLARLRDVFTIDRVLALTPDGALPEGARLPSRDMARELVRRIIAELGSEAGDIYKDILRYFLLEELDRGWKEHLRNMDHLRDGIGLRGYGQKDPKLEYKREGFELFRDLLYRIREGSFRALTRIRVRREETEQDDFTHKDGVAGHSYSGGDTAAGTPAPAVRAEPKLGRNDPCPCGSGKKYKKCCGA
ncbi:MAG: SEC-C domain-containing protein, partial [Deltaproteobacteria bacterium]|nr:SEC-C domain-containing protein [Deltaproteobacteria bacterium]